MKRHLNSPPIVPNRGTGFSPFLRQLLYQTAPSPERDDQTSPPDGPSGTNAGHHRVARGPQTNEAVRSRRLNGTRPPGYGSWAHAGEGGRKRRADRPRASSVVEPVQLYRFEASDLALDDDDDDTASTDGLKGGRARPVAAADTTICPLSPFWAHTMYQCLPPRLPDRLPSSCLSGPASPTHLLWTHRGSPAGSVLRRFGRPTAASEAGERIRCHVGRGSGFLEEEKCIELDPVGSPCDSTEAAGMGGVYARPACRSGGAWVAIPHLVSPSDTRR